MAAHVSEIMNHEVLSFDPDAPARAALSLLLRMGLTTAPVVDEEHHPIGVVSQRELVRAAAGAKVSACMRVPAVVTRPDTPLLDAARLLDEADLHHLAVVGPHRRLIGFVSSLDLLRGMIGAPVSHPESFVHWDDAAGAAFSNDRVLDADQVGDVPATPGLVVITRGGAGRTERVVWAETTLDLQGWLRAYLDGSELSDRLGAGGGQLRYRYAELDDWRLRESAAFVLRAQGQLDEYAMPDVDPR
jgi:hypothetical protein